jgi:glutamine amidotransferase PdxT
MFMVTCSKLRRPACTIPMCAGAKQGGQKLLQCMKIHVSRNFFGAQIASFEQQLPAHSQLQQFGPGDTYRAIFIRAPAILTADKESVTVLSEYTLSDEESTRLGAQSVIVAAQSKNMLVTAFHPELTADSRWCVLHTSAEHMSLSGQGMLKMFMEQNYTFRNARGPCMT